MPAHHETILRTNENLGAVLDNFVPQRLLLCAQNHAGDIRLPLTVRWGKRGDLQLPHFKCSKFAATFKTDFSTRSKLSLSTFRPIRSRPVGRGRMGRKRTAPLCPASGHGGADDKRDYADGV